VLLFVHLSRSLCSALHPAVLRLGLKYAAGTITGSNARAVALLATFRQVINDYVTPPQKVPTAQRSATSRAIGISLTPSGAARW